MKRAAFVILLATLAPVAGARADDLHMRSGQTVEGTFLGADARQIKFLGPDGQPTYDITVSRTASATFATEICYTFCGESAPNAPTVIVRVQRLLVLDTELACRMD